jgi:hypothetical protein
MTRPLCLILLVSALARVEAATDASLATIREGLMAAGRERRDAAEQSARSRAREDPAALAALWGRLDLRGRSVLARALASAGTRKAARTALELSADAEAPVFRACLEGLARGGRNALFAPAREQPSPRRRAALERLRLRWNVERELSRLKSASGPTGHYTGQFEHVKALGAEVLPIFFDIAEDRRVPFFGEASSGPYESIHPFMVRFVKRELRNLAVHAFGELTEPADEATLARLEALWERFWNLDQDRFRFERESLAPGIAFSLHDCGRPEPVEDYIQYLGRIVARGDRYDALEAMWDLGYANMRIGRYEEGKAAYEFLLTRRDSGVSRHLAAYNLACAFSMRAMQEPKQRVRFKDTALDYLERAVELNFWDWQWMEEDGDLDFIRDEPRYRRVLAHLQRTWPDRRKGTVSKRREEFLVPGSKQGDD